MSELKITYDKQGHPLWFNIWTQSVLDAIHCSIQKTHNINIPPIAMDRLGIRIDQIHKKMLSEYIGSLKRTADESFKKIVINKDQDELW